MKTEARPVPRDQAPSMARRHDLDALRASAMLLGIAYHASLSFAAGMPWLVQDVRQTRWLYIFQAAAHGFRMPLFFLISGFFTAMLWRKRGLKALLGNRLRRILLPCFLGLVTVAPAVSWVAGKAMESGFRKWVNAAWTRPGGPDLWTAAADGDAEEVSRILAGGAAIDGLKPDFGVTPLTIAALRDQRAVARLLLDRGADINGRNRDGGTALHAAAFLGREAIAELLVSCGADVRARNKGGETPVDPTRADWPTTRYIAGLFRIDPERIQVESGRQKVIALLRQAGVEIAPPAQPGEAGGGNADPGIPGSILRWLAGTPFGHLWFLWFLCWLIGGFAVYAAIADRRGWKPAPRRFVLSPAAPILMIPLTMIPAWFMTMSSGGFGPDTSLGFLPAPHVLLYYALFFGFGVVYYECDDAAGLLGRRWRIALPASLLIVFPAALELTTGIWGLRDSLLPGRLHRVASVALQVSYAWLMTFASMGLFRAILKRESGPIRYLSDSAYWLYLAHLPLIIGVQLLVRDWEMPAAIKCSAVALAVTGFLLIVYHTCIRYTWVGTLLNGPRKRNSTGATTGTR